MHLCKRSLFLMPRVLPVQPVIHDCSTLRHSIFHPVHLIRSAPNSHPPSPISSRNHAPQVSFQVLHVEWWISEPVGYPTPQVSFQALHMERWISEPVGLSNLPLHTISIVFHRQPNMAWGRCECPALRAPVNCCSKVVCFFYPWDFFTEQRVCLHLPTINHLDS
ncbi:hypothetical protein AVEN_186003-1 [Araneus ventricosus]|uniref:Uncharacterized protein n=1 Tax=Araneus ventricosus TaxID=182803 RepID=A0A4Y2ML93_ARAVE|nr:hypothetical protein AVEN_168603-1 [Araneus ventricosus]GBN26403.1 hypothetical protein AVEN_186003-1 [Araneus ventricosus]